MRVSGTADATSPFFFWGRKCASINAPGTSTDVLRGEPRRGPPAPGSTRSPVRRAGSACREALVDDDQPALLEHRPRRPPPAPLALTELPAAPWTSLYVLRTSRADFSTNRH